MFELMKNNFKDMLFRQRKMLIFIILAQIFSVIIIMFSYGVVNHYNTKVDVAESSSLKFIFSLKQEKKDEGTYLEYEEVRNFFLTILPCVENKLNYFYVDAQCGEYHAMSTNGYRNGKMTVSYQMKNKVSLLEGEKFSEEDMALGKYCIVAGKNMIDGSGQVIIGDNIYEVRGILGIDGLENDFFVPFGSMPSNAKIDYTSIFFTKPLLETEYKFLVETATRFYGDKIDIPEFEGIKNESNYKAFRGIMLVTVVLICICALNYCIIYRYIFEKRRRTFAIYRICGGTRIMLSIVYMVEMLIVSVFTLIVGTAIFHYIILPDISNMFEYISFYCSKEAYAKISSIYVVVVFVVYSALIKKFVCKTPISLIKEV